jgi:predicted transposase YbfD/YdcC
VRPIKPDERERWDGLIREYHYLGSELMVGETLRYVAESDGEWLALLGWAAAALKCAPRDRWIGWPPEVQWQRLKLVANNVRFLVLAHANVPNLASRVLALNLKRLSRDWRAARGHPVLLAETFVDAARFRGTCYRAAGWIELGRTRGFRKASNGGYVKHGEQKLMLVHPLVADAAKRLRKAVPEPDWRLDGSALRLSDGAVDALWQRLQSLPDWRKAKGKRHQLVPTLALAMCAIISGARGYAAIAEWVARAPQPLLRRLRCRYDRNARRFTPPSEPTLRRVLQSVDAAAVDATLTDWVMARIAGAQELICVDGKTVRGARRADGSKVHLLSAYVAPLGVVIGQCEVPQKSNEIPALPALLEPFDLAGKVVSADALHTQVKTARFLVEEKAADFIFTVKGNQKTLLGDIEACPFPEREAEAETTEKGHGRLETRRLWTTTDLNGYLKFPYVRQVFCVERHTVIVKTGEVRHERVFGITSLAPEKADADRLLALNRGHWGIENRVHWVRDVTFDEDRSQIRSGTAPRVIAAIRNFAISLYRLRGLGDNIARALRAFAARPFAAWQLIASG